MISRPPASNGGRPRARRRLRRRGLRHRQPPRCRPPAHGRFPEATHCSSRPTRARATKSSLHPGRRRNGLAGRDLRDRWRRRHCRGRHGGPARLPGRPGARQRRQGPAGGERRERHRLALRRCRAPRCSSPRRLGPAERSRPASPPTARRLRSSTPAAPAPWPSSASSATTCSPSPGEVRSLGLDNTNPPDYLHGAGQVGFTPDGTHLVVTTKASTSSYEVFNVSPGGNLGAPPVVTASATPVPFSFSFDARGPSRRRRGGDEHREHLHRQPQWVAHPAGLGR